MYVAFYKQTLMVPVFVVRRRMSIASRPYVLVRFPCCRTNPSPQILKWRLWAFKDMSSEVTQARAHLRQGLHDPQTP